MPLLTLKKKKPFMWRTSDGMYIPVNQMGNGHLINTIRFLQRKFGRVYSVVPAYVAMAKEATSRGLVV